MSVLYLKTVCHKSDVWTYVFQIGMLKKSTELM